MSTFKIHVKIRILIQPLGRICCYGNTGVVDAGQICVIFMQRTVTKQKLSQRKLI